MSTFILFVAIFLLAQISNAVRGRPGGLVISIVILLPLLFAFYPILTGGALITLVVVLVAKFVRDDLAHGVSTVPQTPSAPVSQLAEEVPRRPDPTDHDEESVSTTLLGVQQLRTVAEDATDANQLDEKWVSTAESQEQLDGRRPREPNGIAAGTHVEQTDWSNRFDPYQEWLQIPPGPRPPNHYVLLGLHEFADNRDEINRCATARMARARQYQVGKYEKEALLLVAEISKALVCLTDPSAKARYDKALAESH